jgi:hypothetical protein
MSEFKYEFVFSGKNDKHKKESHVFSTELTMLEMQVNPDLMPRIKELLTEVLPEIRAQEIPSKKGVLEIKVVLKAPESWIRGPKEEADKAVW